MRTISYIDLVSETCDFCSVIAQDISFLKMYEIVGEGEICREKKYSQTLIANNFALGIENESLANKTLYTEMSLMDFLKQQNLTGIDIYFTDGSEEKLYFPWSEKDDHKNMFQHNDFEEEDLVVINIKKENE